MSLAARPLDPLRWLGVPALQAMGLTLLMTAPVQIFGRGFPEPIWPMIPVFAWAVIRPSLLAPVAVLMLGLFLDLIWGGPKGLWPLALLVAYGATLASRNMMVGQSRFMMWIWFGAMTAVAMTTAFIATMLDVQTRPNLVAVLWQFLATVVWHPFAHRLIERFEDADVRFR